MSKFHLLVGIAGGLGATFLSIQACHLFTGVNGLGTALVLALNVAYCLSMLLRRGALKEPEFWSLASLVWLAYLFLKPGVGNNAMLSTISALKPLTLQIIVFLWSQHTQVHSLAPSVFVSIGLLVLCIATYTMTAVQLINHTSRNVNQNPYSALAAKLGVLALSLIAFIFKLAFTAEHTPALVPLSFGQLHPRLRALDQVLMAQTTFAGCLGGLALLTIHSREKMPTRADSGMSQICVEDDCLSSYQS
jgi:hypothetical protein